MDAELTLSKIDSFIESNQDSSHRRHLGASIIGEKCSKKLWFSFRWAKSVKHKGRILRLFERGHLEEERFVRFFKQADIDVWCEDENGKQFLFSEHKGHFGGSLDSVLKGIVGIEEEACLGEYKTHGEKSFKLLQKEGMRVSKPTHYAQMQVYMRAFDLKYGFYLAVNKNTDELYAEIITLDTELADFYRSKAKRIIFNDGEAPQRINDRPGHWECRFCDFHGICHGTEIPESNCRTCVFSTPVEDGKWQCSRMQSEIPDFLMESGCEEHLYREGMLNMKIIDYDKTGEYVEYEVVSEEGTKHSFKNGKDYNRSSDMVKWNDTNS